MLSTQRITAPMLPVDVCLNVINILPVNETKQVLDAILALFSKDDLIALLGDVVRRILALGNSELQDFIPDDFSTQLMAALTQLHAEKTENLIYLLSTWLVSKWQLEERDIVDMKFGEIMGWSLQEENPDFENIEGMDIESKPKVAEPSVTLDEATGTSVVTHVKKKKRGRKRKEDKEVVIHLKQEVPETIAENTPDDGTRRSARKNKGKNPLFDELKDSDDEGDGPDVLDGEDSEEEWKADTREADQEENEDGRVEVSLAGDGNSIANPSQSTRRKRGRPRKINATADRIKTEGLPCSVCSHVSKNYIQYKKHLSSHENEPWPRCDKCKKLKLFKNEELLAEHVKDKHGPFVCNECGKGFTSKQALMKHGIMHGEAPQFQCSSCEKGFSTNYSLRLHENVYHKGIKPFLCTECGNGFTTKVSMQEHMNMHNGVKPFECKICDMQFTRKATLRLHNINEHNEETKNAPCPICGKTYRNIYIRNAHMKTHDKSSEKSQSFRTCDICGRQFKGKWELQKHIKVVHLKIKEFKCTVCLKLFATRVHLQEHMATHTRQAQFFCDICGQGFVHRVTLKAHVFRHKGTKQCECPICHKRFDVPRFLTRHIKDVHKNIPIPELPKFEVPRSHLASHLRHNGKYRKKVDPPKEISKGIERVRPAAAVTKAKKRGDDDDGVEVTEQVQVLDESMYQALGPEVVENMQVIDAADFGQTQIVQILDDMVDLNGSGGEQQILQEGGNVVYETDNIVYNTDNVVYEDGGEKELAYNTVEINLPGEITYDGTGLTEEIRYEITDPTEEMTEVTENTAVGHENDGLRVVEIEINGQKKTLEVPKDCKYVQVGDQIIAFDHE